MMLPGNLDKTSIRKLTNIDDEQQDALMNFRTKYYKCMFVFTKTYIFCQNISIKQCESNVKIMLK